MLYPQQPTLSLTPANSSPADLAKMSRRAANNNKPAKKYKPRKKYKETPSTQKLNYQIQKLQNELEFQRKKTKELQENILTLKHQKKQREDAIRELTNNVEQTQIAIDTLIQNAQTRKKLKCYIELERVFINENDDDYVSCADNLCIVKLKFLDSNAKIDINAVVIQWQRSYYGQVTDIHGANKMQYQLCADDIGAIIQCEVRLKDDAACFETAVLKGGAIKMSKICLKSAEQDLTQIAKSKEIQFEVVEENTTNALIVQFNRDKVKLRTPKNETLDKEQYNMAMRIELCTINPHRFTIKFASNREYILKSKSSLARDNIAILLRCYIQKIQPTNNHSLYEFYIISTNQKMHTDSLKTLGQITSTSRPRSRSRSGSWGEASVVDEHASIISRILAPITSYSNMNRLSSQKMKSYTNLIGRGNSSKTKMSYFHILQRVRQCRGCRVIRWGLELALN